MGSRSSPEGRDLVDISYVPAIKLRILKRPETWADLEQPEASTLCMNYAFLLTVILASDPESRILMLGLHQDLCLFYILYFI